MYQVKQLVTITFCVEECGTTSGGFDFELNSSFTVTSPVFFPKKFGVFTGMILSVRKGEILN